MDFPGRVAARLKTSRSFLEGFPVTVKLKDGITPVAMNLRDFMYVSAAFMLDSEVPMRRCVECGSAGRHPPANLLLLHARLVRASQREEVNCSGWLSILSTSTGQR